MLRMTQNYTQVIIFKCYRGVSKNSKQIQSKWFLKIIFIQQTRFINLQHMYFKEWAYF